MFEKMKSQVLHNMGNNIFVTVFNYIGDNHSAAHYKNEESDEIIQLRPVKTEGNIHNIFDKIRFKEVDKDIDNGNK